MTTQTNQGEVATLEIGEGVSAYTFQCDRVIFYPLALGKHSRSADAVIVFRDPWLADVLTAWGRSNAPCTFMVHGQKLCMVPRRWVAETLPGSTGMRFMVSLEEVVVVSKGYYVYDRERLAARCSTCGCGGSCPSKARGEVDPDAVPCARCGCRWCGPAVAGSNLGCAGKALRLREEAPLVELVKAVPAGLDPIGWRAAVLAVHEGYHGAVVHGAETIESWVRHGDGGMVSGQQARAAYARAVAPKGPRPEPYRRRAPGLPLDAD